MRRGPQSVRAISSAFTFFSLSEAHQFHLPMIFTLMGMKAQLFG
jgi:hypothetical protein